MSVPSLLPYLLALGDDALVLGHRLSEWCGHAPVLEEDVALANLALDLIGQAQLFYTYAGEIEGKGRDADAFAYLRDVRDFRNVLLVEQPNGDFAVTTMRQLLDAAFICPYYGALMSSADARLAAIAAKAVKEMAYHRRHAAEWTIRLGDGTAESHTRTAAALDELWPYTGELFEMDDDERALAAQGIAVDREGLRAAWRAAISDVLTRATLVVPSDRWMQSGGRRGRHSEHLGHMLAAMQVLQRTYPGAVW
ncbi:MAG: 1,2-phenylacetyl-CoA epoxidase subunit PaaC [Hyphomicrobiaceae bacterium]